MQRHERLLVLGRIVLCAALAGSQYGFAQAASTAADSSTVADSTSADLPDAPALGQQTVNSTATQTTPSPDDGKQTKRILWIIPNFRSVSTNVKLPPVSTKDKFVLMFEDSFDYSSFIYVGILSGIGQAQNSYPEFHQGAAGYGRYYWHSFADNLNGNIFTEALLPSALHEDPRYYTLGHGGVVKRTGYSVGRLLITRTDSGHETPNFSEVIGNGAASGISGLYYPSRERTWTKTGQKWAIQLALDGFSNVVKEFWPDINQAVFRGKE
jgi:hypothetical protein